MGINENVVNEWSSIATDASREGKKHQISSPQTGQAELQKMIDKMVYLFQSNHACQQTALIILQHKLIQLQNNKE
ncbi:hypothetical protein [Spiroplasma citri]|uniref:Uncharacterized protein n=1 Tax=Spiroplasma citri TaxID=2133 RepID=A0AAX3SYF8_SPICI|nr:hypothetical protein [Spiroplasma citri]APE75667.1 hypothetical protein SCITRI_001801 [Spiroplasma citri]WFG96310.1 hypothetical protein M0C40_09595 [Spiroplasma citri]WFH00199.1 hypothetical protein M1771_09545 [Spiroplasma citri]